MLRPSVTLLPVLALAIAGCAPSAAPRPADDPTACAPGRGSAPTSYPGWPGSVGQTAPQEIVPVMVSPELAVGPSRFLFTLIDDQNRLVASRDVTVELSFFDLATDPATPAVTVDAAYLETEDGRGLYRASVDFRCSGEWGAEVTARIPNREDRTARVLFPVAVDTTTPSIGEPVPSIETSTADTPSGIAAISTDTDPDPDFYRVSEADALAKGDPFVLVFATPAFCQTAACGPTLDTVKNAATGFKDALTFIHVEPYILELRDGQLQPVLDQSGGLQTVEAVETWALPAEPFIFVVGGDGRLAAKFAGLVSEDELREAFQSVAGG